MCSLFFNSIYFTIDWNFIASDVRVAFQLSINAHAQGFGARQIFAKKVLILKYLKSKFRCWAKELSYKSKRVIENLLLLEQGPVHAKFWKDVKVSTSTIADLLNDTRFPSNPSSSGFLDNFDSPYSIGSHYGLQMWSYFMAPETGQYIFHSACDDYCQVFLSTSDREADKKLIINQQGWSPQYKYDK